MVGRWLGLAISAMNATESYTPDDRDITPCLLEALQLRAARFAQGLGMCNARFSRVDTHSWLRELQPENLVVTDGANHLGQPMLSHRPFNVLNKLLIGL